MLETAGLTEALSETRFHGAGLACRRGGRLVFEGLDFAVAPGRALILKGPNGSGKSSLLRLMAGLVRPERGRLGWDDLEVQEDLPGHAARLSYVGHAEAAKAAMTAAETLDFWTGVRGGERAIVGPALDALGLAHRADFPVRYLSSGQKRRLALARLLVAETPLWILDEPTVGLDADGIVRLEGMVERHLAAGGMLVAATHQGFAVGAAASELDLLRFAPGRDGLVADLAALGGAA